MKSRSENESFVRETLTQAAMDLEAAAKAARAAAEAIPDPKAAWDALQPLCSHLESANYLVDQVQAIVKGISVRRGLSSNAPARE